MSWTELVATALLGTDRRAVPEESFAELAWEAPENADPAAVLLDLASAYSAYLRAGTVPATRPPSAPAPPQMLAFPSKRALDLLGRFLEARSIVPIAEWVRVCDAHGLGLPPLQWATVADVAVTTHAIDRPVLRRVYGERGRAFLALREDWARLLTGAESRDEPQPERTREQVSEQWGSASAAERVALLDSLVVGLGQQDVPFLETAIADRRISVAGRAAELLSTIPTSAYSQRMTQRALAAVTLERRRLKSDLLVIRLPVHDDALAADGVPARPPASFPGGAQTWLLHNVVAAARLDAWTEHTGLDPEALLGLLVDAEWKAALHVAWRTAAVRQSDARWARAIVATGDLHESLLGLLSAEDLARAAVRAWQTPSAAHLAPALTMSVPGPWPTALLDAFVGLAARGGATGMVELAASRAALTDLPRLESAVRAGPAPKLIDYQATAARRQLEELQGLVAARHDVHRSFDPTAPTGEHQ